MGEGGRCLFGWQALNGTAVFGSGGISRRWGVCGRFVPENWDMPERQEVDEVIRWLTGYSQPELEGMLERPVSYGDFFRDAPEPNENRRLIKGVVCGVRVEDIEEPLMREVRYLDKLVDELARGKAMDKILRK